MTNTTNKTIKKRKNIVLKYWYILIVLIVLVVFPKKSFADGISLGVFPPILQITATPPADITAPITISNLSEQSVTLDINLKPFTASEKENGEVSYLSENQSLSADPLILQRIQIKDDVNVVNNVTLAPYQQKRLNLHILLPENEPLSDYYFSVVFSSQAKSITDFALPSPSPTLENQSQSMVGIATNVLLSIGPKGEALGTLVEFSAPLFAEKGPVPFTVRIKNTGDHFITPQGEILIKNMFGQTVGKVDLLPVNILSGTVRAIPDSLQSPDATPSAAFSAFISNLSSPKAVWPESFVLGPYQATLTLALSQQGPLFRKTIYFVGLPIQALLAIVLIIFIIFFIRSRLKTHVDT